MTNKNNRFTVRLAQNEDEIRAAQRLRFEVFCEEMGAKPANPEDAALGLERDRFDPYFDHLLLFEQNEDTGAENVVGAYRLLRGEVARDGIGFYGASEYDLSKLLNSDRKVVELGRSCVAADHRGGAAMHLLWNGLGQYVIENDIEIMFGTASFPGTDLDALREPLAFLHHKHLAPEGLRVRAQPEHFVDMNLMPLEDIDAKSAQRAIPPLIKAYLRLGGFVGEGAFVDHEFNTVDVCLLMDTALMQSRYKDMYSRNARQADT